MIFVICFILAYIPLRLIFPTKVIGKKNLPKKEGYIFTCNHFSNMDPVILDACLAKRIRFLAKKELFKNKFVGFFLKQYGGFPINREKPEMSSIKFALNTLKEKKILGIFPEGTRNKSETDDRLQELKNGVIMFASKGDAKIVPAIIYKRIKAFRKNYIIIGEPFKLEAVDSKRLTKEEIDYNTNKLVSAMNKLREDMDNKIKAKKEKKKRKN